MTATNLQPNVLCRSTPDSFRPCFVVGNGRSGTTLLAVMLGRHSNLAMTPETYFMRMVPRKTRGDLTHKELLDQLFSFSLTADMKMDRAPLEKRFSQSPANYPSLFRAMLEEYAAEHGAGKTRVGEKTPRHVESVPTLIEWFPESRIVCIVRDGRDVALSLLNMPWNEEPRLRGLCMRWSRTLVIAEKLRKRYPRQFMMMRYEDLVDRPREILRQVDEFFGLEFEAQQLNANVRPPNVIPESELGWKAQAFEEIDPSRKATWKKKATPHQLLIMNTMMGKALRRMGYGETEPPPCPLGERLRTALGNAVFRTGLVSLWHRMIERNLPAARAERRRRRQSRNRMSAMV
jgi:hypothetical protein